MDGDSVWGTLTAEGHEPHPGATGLKERHRLPPVNQTFTAYVLTPRSLGP